MITLKLAYRNLIGAGLRTWLNVGILSFIYVLIIWHQGLFSGMQRQASLDMIKDEIAGGQYWHNKYDPYDPLSLEESHGPVPDVLNDLVRTSRAVPLLIRPATIYPEGRAQSILIKGIAPEQKILAIPTHGLDSSLDTLSLMIGKMMASKNDLTVGDMLTIQWRDTNGTFDAIDGEIYFLTTADLYIYRMSDYEWMNLDGAILSRISGYDAYEAVLFRYAELGTGRRNSHGVLCDIIYTN